MRPPALLLMVENVSLARDHRLRKQAQALVAAGYRVSVICRRDPHNHGGTGIHVYEHPSPAEPQTRIGYVREYASSLLHAGWLTLKVFTTEGFDAIQISGTPDIYFLIAGPFKLLGKPLVLDQRDPAPELYEARYAKRDFVYGVLRWLEWASYRTADHVITVNPSVASLAYGRGRRTPGAVSIVGNGPVLDRTHKRSPRASLRKGRRHLCCWLGLMGPQDRVDLSLRAIHHVVHTLGYTDCHFAFLGDGETRQASEQLALELGIQDWVSFAGWVDEEEAFTYLSTADLGLEPNLEEIVSPVKAMEYMAFQLPFVAFDLKETRAVGGRAAAYAPKGDVTGFARLVVELLEDPERRAQMGRVGRERVETRMAWDRQQGRYLSVYERLLPHREENGPVRQRQPRHEEGAVA
jgi:glycosyltransferase involved in cell wall biosynthesis